MGRAAKACMGNAVCPSVHGGGCFWEDQAAAARMSMRQSSGGTFQPHLGNDSCLPHLDSSFWSPLIKPLAHLLKRKMLHGLCCYDIAKL